MGVAPGLLLKVSPEGERKHFGQIGKPSEKPQKKMSELQKRQDSLSLSARHRAGEYRRAFLLPEDRQIALLLRGVERDEGAEGTGTDRSGASPKI